MFNYVTSIRGSNNASAFATEMRMQRYAGNILGSSQYMALRKKELVALMTAKKIATLWFTLSLANHHWEDLQNLFPTTEQLVDETDSEYMKRRKKIALQNYANNPAVVNEMFVERVKLFMKYFLGSDGLNASWHWYRFEWQKRGNIHVHGLARLNCDPGLSKYGENVILGRKAQKVIELYIKIKKEMHLDLPSILTDLQFKDVPPEDEHLPYTINQLKIKFNDENYVMSETDVVSNCSDRVISSLNCI